MNKLLGLFYGMTVGAVSIGFASCGNDGEPDREVREDLPTENISIYVYPGIQQEDGILPRMIVAGDKFTCTEIYDPEHPDIMTFHIMSAEERMSAILSASKDGVWIIEHDPLRSETMCNATVIVPDGTSYQIAVGTYDINSRQFSLQNSLQMDAPDASRSAVGMEALSRGDDMDFARELVVKDILNPISKLGKMSSILSKIPCCQSASAVLSIYNKVAIPVAKMMLYSNDEKEYNKMMYEYVLDELKNVVVEATGLKSLETGKKLYKAATWAFITGGSLVEDECGDVDDQFVLTTTNSYSFTSRTAQQWTFSVYDESSRYKLDCNLLSVKGQQASVRGSFTGDLQGFTITGFILYRNGVEQRRIEQNLYSSPTYLFQNLGKGAEYHVTAFATVMGVRYESKPVSFYIDGDLEVSAGSLTFGENGGSDDVEITPPSDKWELSVTSSEKWCKATLQGRKLNVRVDATKENRTATLIVKATSPYGEVQEKVISVNQKVLGDIIGFKGELTCITKDTYPSDPSYNSQTKYTLESILVLMKMGKNYSVTYGGSISGIMLVNCPVSSTAPANLTDDVKITRFNCVNSGNVIRITASSLWTIGGTGELTLEIDLNAMKVRVKETYKWTGGNYDNVQHTIENSCSGTLSYVEENS